MTLAQLFPSLLQKRQAAVPKISGKFRDEIYNQLATFIEDGFTPFQTCQILAIEYSDIPRDPRTKAYRHLARKLTQGRSIAEALKGSVPDADLYVLEAAEKIGKLDQGFRRLVYFSEKSAQLKSKLFSLGKPMGLAAAALAILYAFANGVLPDFATMVSEDSRGDATVSLMAMGGFLEVYTLPILLSIGLYAAISTAFLSRLSHPLRDDVLNRFFPPWNFYQLFVSNSFLLTLGTMMESGIRLKDALPMIKSLSGRYLKDHIDRMEVLLAEGAKEGKAIATDIFDKDTKRLLRIYGQSDQFEARMQTIAQRSLEGSLRRVDKIVDGANLVMKVVIALIIIWIVGGIGGVVIPMIEENI